jgi:hypothetical protein
MPGLLLVAFRWAKSFGLTSSQLKVELLNTLLSGENIDRSPKRVNGSLGQSHAREFASACEP